MKVTIVGARGYVGRNLGAYLREQGVAVHECSSSIAGGIDPETGALAPGFSLPEGTRAVFYLAQSPHYRRGSERVEHLFAVNVASAVGVAEAARVAGVSHFLYASTGNVYAPSFAPLSEDSPLGGDDFYGMSKRQGEEALRPFERHFAVTTLRIFGVFGPEQSDKLVPNLYRAVRDERSVRLEGNPNDATDLGGTRFSLCYIGDFVRILHALIERGGERVLNVAGPEGISIRALAEEAGRHLGKAPRFESARDHRNFDLIADTGRLRRALSPTFSPLEESLARTFDSFARTRA